MTDAALQVEVPNVRGYPDTIATDLGQCDEPAAEPCNLDVEGDGSRATVTAADAATARWLYEWLEESVEYYREEFVNANGEHDAARELATAVFEELDDDR